MDNWNITYFLYVYSEFHSTIQIISNMIQINEKLSTLILEEDTYLNSFLAGYEITVTISHILMIVKSHTQRYWLHLTGCASS